MRLVAGKLPGLLAACLEDGDGDGRLVHSLVTARSPPRTAFSPYPYPSETGDRRS